MKDASVKIRISEIFLDESIYPREDIDHKRVGIFIENLRDGFKFEPIEIQSWPNSNLPGEKDTYRILDGVHRWTAHKKAGLIEIDAIIKTLNGIDPLLYAAKLAIGPKQLTEAETKHVSLLT